MAAPLIGITSGYEPAAQGGRFGTITVGESYVQAVLRAGGLPLVLPVGLPADALPGLLERLDGLLLTGGGDIDPGLFGGAEHPRVYGIDARRDDLELRAARAAAERGTPFLGICRGIQVINVALGGSLLTDIADQHPDALRHDWFPDIPRDYLAHPVAVAAGSRLAEILQAEILQGETIEVNSLHHQAIDRLAPGLRATAWSPDRLVEAVELPGHPFGLGVQWHPEWIQQHAPQERLFQALVRAARRE